jgi:YjbE family integral membrane protein
MGEALDFLLQDMTHGPFWAAALQIVFVNLILSGDNAVVIAMACLTLPRRQRLWGIILGAAVAVLLRFAFTFLIAQALAFPYLKLIGGALLFYVAIKLVTEDTDAGEGVERAQTIWRAVQIVAIADIVMSLDNVIAIAASAEAAAAQVDAARAFAIKATLIAFGLATSIPLIVAGSAILMPLFARYRALVWSGGALLGWIAGEVMAGDPALSGWFNKGVLDQLQIWGGPVGGIIAVAAGYIVLGRSRRLLPDEVFAGGALLAWIVLDRVNESVFGGIDQDTVPMWSIRAALMGLIVLAYAVFRNRFCSGQEKSGRRRR